MVGPSSGHYAAPRATSEPAITKGRGMGLHKPRHVPTRLCSDADMSDQVALEDVEADIDELVIDRHHQRRGYGREVIRRGLESVARCPLG